MSESRFFVNPHPNETVHIYDRRKTTNGTTSDRWRGSLCGLSIGKPANGRRLRTTREEVDCGTCLRLHKKITETEGL